MWVFFLKKSIDCVRIITYNSNILIRREEK
nr:MAG TPA: hypothetical protein [Caudoviricetes sp.]